MSSSLPAPLRAAGTCAAPAALLVLVLVSGCGRGEKTAEARTAAPGEPVPGLGPEALERFGRGQALFNRVFTPEEGMGPLFNENQCSACHTDPASGGTGEQLVTKATRFDPATGECDLLSREGGENVRRQATPALRALGVSREEVPLSATEVVRFTVPFLFGLGFVDAIPEEAIRARADPGDRDGDGISGRAGTDPLGGLGRFGRKAEVATLERFVDSALRFEMGLTTPLNPAPETLSGRPLPEGVDPLPEPEVDEETVRLLADYIRYLAPPERRLPEAAAEREAVDRGDRLFEGLGCTSCHVPSMTTGPSDVPSLDRKRARLYSDLLLHDLGPELSNVCAPGATPTELRTAILMGVGRRSPYLHDGRTLSLRDAILLHGGEARPARDRFDALSRVRQEDVIRFLRTL